MGRADRLRRQAIREGRVLSIRQRRDRLMKEAKRLAAPDLFFNREWDDRPVSSTQDDIYETLVNVLPKAMDNLGERWFTVADLSRRKDFMDMVGKMLLGILAHQEDKFKFSKLADRGGLWSQKKRQGRKRTGKWVLCRGCGVPRYSTPGKPSKGWCLSCYRNRGNGLPGRPLGFPSTITEAPL